MQKQAVLLILASSLGLATPWGDGWPPEAAQGQCSWDLRELKNAFSKQSAWAVQMMESGVLSPTGLAFGSTYQLGHYEECMDITAPPLWGKYCLAKVHFDWREAMPSAEDSLWAKIRNSSRVKSMNSREWVQWAACLPSSCSSEDAQQVLSAYLEPMRRSLGVQGKGVTVDDVTCVSMDPKEPDLNPEWKKEMTRGQLAMGIFLFGLLVLVLSSTTYEECFLGRRQSGSLGYGQTTVPIERGSAIWERLLLSFSLRRNWRRLAKTRPRGEPPRPFDAVHGLKSITMMLVTVGHRTFFSLGAPMFNTQYMENFYALPETALIMGGTIVVDTFFFVSGCLLLNGILDQRSRSKASSLLPLMYMRRYARLVPALMVIVAFYATLLPLLGDGPLWNSAMGRQRDNCINNWWTNLLLLHTVIHPDNMCVIQSWYVAVEFHVFMVCAPLALLFRYRRTLATRILLLASVISLLVPFILTAVLHLDPVLMPFISVLQDLSKDPTFLKVYIPSYMRMAPYFFGMFCALAIRRANKRSLKLRKSIVVTCHVCSFLLCLLVCYSSWIFFRPEVQQLNPLAAAAFSVFTRIGWSLAMAWQLFSAATGHGWWIGRMMAWRPLTPFGRLTYGAFLTHAGIQLYDVSTLVMPQHVTIFYMVTKNISDYFFSNFLAMFLFLCIEGPVASLEKVLIGATSAEKGSPTVGSTQNQQTFSFVVPSVVTTGKPASDESQH